LLVVRLVHGRHEMAPARVAGALDALEATVVPGTGALAVPVLHHGAEAFGVTRLAERLEKWQQKPGQ